MDSRPDRPLPAAGRLLYNRDMMPIYLDNNSTTPLLPEVAAAMAATDAIGYANPASAHSAGRRAHRALEDAREEIAAYLGADITRPHTADRLIFTSGGTEANNLALLGLTGALNSAASRTARGRIIISAIEHQSVSGAAELLANLDWQIDRIAVTGEGIVDLTHFDRLLATDSALGPPRLVSVMLANNETGVIQPVVEIAKRARAAGVPVHTDAAQAIGKIPVSFCELGVAAMSVAPHKFHGPRGIGALVVRHDVSVHPLLRGAPQQFGLRPGTEAVAPAIGFLTALKAWNRDQRDRTQHLIELRDRFESAMKEVFPAAVINGQAASRLPHTSNVAFPGRDRQSLMMALDLAGVCCSTGSACASGSSEPSPTLLSMDLPREIAASSLRFSVGATTSTSEVDDAIRLISNVLRRTAPSMTAR
ncbi:MAG: cysteine desulfurase [Pirellulales bacterium]|nr:cysteine desulfurase [Pirellulales bacterium]